MTQITTEEETEVFFESSDAPIMLRRDGNAMSLVVLDKDDHEDVLCSATTTAHEMRWLAISILEMAQTAQTYPSE